MTTVKTILREARALIEDPARWTQGASARTADGRETFAACPDAVQWCAAGAVRKVSDFPGSANHARANALLGAQARAIGHTTPAVNDALGHTAVLQMFDAAIAAAEAAEVGA